MKKITFTVYFVICFLFISTQALAWGALEQGILWGIGGTLVGQQLIRGAQQPQVVYVQPGYQQYPHVAPQSQYYAPSRFTHRPMYRMVDVWIPECGCYRSVMVQVN